MNNTEISTLAKAGFVVVAAEGQTQTNLQVISEIFSKIIPGITSQLVKEGEAMTLRKMINNIENFSQPHNEATLLFKTLSEVFVMGDAHKLALELKNLLRNKVFSSSDMPSLAMRMENETLMFGLDQDEIDNQANRKNIDERRFIELGKSKLKQRNYEEAINDLDKAIKMNPFSEEAFFMRAKARKAIEDLDGASADYTQVIKLNPGNASAYNNLGNVMYELGMFELAILDFKRALELEPCFDTARKNLMIVEREK